MRIKEAQILLSAGSYPGAFYLAGYAVECGLKACIAKETREYDFPDLDEVRASYTHDLRKLLSLAKLQDRLSAEMKSNRQLETYWAWVVNWGEAKRYELGVTEREASDLCAAIADPTNGVLQWLSKCW